MAVIRADVLLAGLAGAHSRSARGASFMQLARAPGWAKKPYVLKNAPHTIVSPHPGQIQIRVAFGAVGKSMKGSKGFKDGLPIVAATVKERITGFKAPFALPEEEYPSKVKHTVHTMEELQRMLAEIEKRRGVPPTRTAIPAPAFR